MTATIWASSSHTDGKTIDATHADTSRRDLHVLEVARLVVNADAWRRDPVRELARLRNRLHQADDEFAVRLRRQPFADFPIPRHPIDEDAGRRNFHVLELANLAMEADVRQFKLEVDA